MKHLPLTFKIKEIGQSEDGSETFVEGWANKLIVDRGNDRIVKGAWLLDNYQKNPIILFNHDKDKPIGKAVAVEQRDDGLYIKARLSKSKDPMVSYVRDMVKEGILNAFSVGFDAKDEQKDADGVNDIKQAELFEVSIVSIPMNQDSLFSISTKDLKVESYGEARGIVLRAKGAEVAAALQAACDAELSEDDKFDKVALVQDVAKTSGASEADVMSVLAGEMTPVPEKVLESFAVALDLDLESLKKLDMADVAVEAATKTTTQEKGANPMKKGTPTVQAVMVPKASCESMDQAKAMCKEAGWMTESMEENDDYYMAIQEPADAFKGLVEMTLDDGMKAMVGMKGGDEKALDPATEEPPATPPAAATSEEQTKEDMSTLVTQFEDEVKATTESEESAPAAWVADPELWSKAKAASMEAFGECRYPFVVWYYVTNGGGKKSAESVKTKDLTPVTTPMGSETGVGGDDNPYLMQARQTNVLLGSLIQEFQKVAKVLEGAMMKPSEAATEIAKATTTEVPSEGDQDSQDEKMIDTVRQKLKALEERIKGMK